MPEPLIFEKSRPGRRGVSLPQCDVPRADLCACLGEGALRAELPLPEVSELDVVRHFTRLSHENYAVDLGFYPLGSCTMKYNPKVNEAAAALPGFAALHPLQPVSTVQGALALTYDLQQMLAEICGMDAVSLQPAAGAHGELLAMMMIHAYLRDRGDTERNVVVIPDSAHGTNPASAARCGFKVKTIRSNERGCVDLDALRAALSENTAAVMLTNPNTAGMFERDILEICETVHAAGALVYCDGANMNALMGVARPGDMGFDLMHLNLHKTFSTPHGGGGPGCGAVCVKQALEPYLPVPRVVFDDTGDAPRFRMDQERPQSVGKIISFQGAFLIAVRAYVYLLSLGAEGVREVGLNAVLNANYLRVRLAEHFDIAFGNSPCMHEVVLSAQRFRQYGVRALDISKRLIDYGYHPPTNYFPLIVPESIMIEPTETESKETLDAFIEVMAGIAAEAAQSPELLTGAPHETVVTRLNETAAVKQLDVRYEPLFEKG